MIQQALLSVSDKTGIVDFARALHERGVKLLSTGGTAKLLAESGLPVTEVADYTGFPEMLDGRVKTLHPKVHGGILARRDLPEHMAALSEHSIPTIDLLVVNLYPFQQTVAKDECSLADAIENIDIGGPTMLRSAAKNHEHVAVLTDPDQYDRVLAAFEASGGVLSASVRRQLALEAFAHTAAYDAAITRWMQARPELDLQPETSAAALPWLEALPLRQQLRYGENPHQKAGWYSAETSGWGGAVQLQGKELSTNNLLDLEAALATVREFGYGSGGLHPASRAAAVVVKHTNPCGVAVGDGTATALTRALDADRVSAFGGIVALNGCVDAAAAKELTSLFLECVVAPSFAPEAREILSAKGNLRLLELAPEAIDAAGRDHVRSILGGVLVQDLDDELVTPDDWTVATDRAPTATERDDLCFAWQLVRHVRSNAIVVARDGQSLGVGAGQMNRVGSARIALEAAGDRAKGAVLASDGFFPFDDTVRLAAEHGITAVIHPGGSKRDDDSIRACNELGVAMLLTGRRHFLH